jgi:hypothetical protein
MKNGKFFEYSHPEAKENEIFITNSSEETYHIIKWKSKRRGMYAYDKKWNLLSDIKFPVFALRSEVDAKRNIVNRKSVIKMAGICKR